MINLLDLDGFSVINVVGDFDLKLFLGKKNLFLEKSFSSYEQELKYQKCVFKTTAGFYLYLVRKKDTENFELIIYYKEDQKNEVIIFLNQIKNKKNETN